MKLKIAIVGALALAAANAMACYTVYDAQKRVVWQGSDPPVDMSLPLHEAVTHRFGAGATMVFNQNDSCTPVSIARVARPTGATPPPNTLRMERTGRQYSPSSAAPLLTDRRTADANGLPHTEVAGDVVMVPPAAAARADIPTFSVIHSRPLTDVAAIPDTTSLGAGPDTRSMGAGPARPVARSNNTVITEMNDPPLTIIQRGGDIIIRRD
jgi:hypothetical protein